MPASLLKRSHRTVTVSALLATGMLAPVAASFLPAARANAPEAPAPAGKVTLNVGDSAPALKPAKWLKGAPLPAFQKGQVYVVEFWATWCGPCKANIPRLTEMAKKYRGKAEIIGVDIWESSDPTIKTLPKVEKFVKAQGTRMDYHVAADTTTNRIADAWMKAAGLEGIPSAFIVGKDGKIAWIGNPATGMDTVLAQVVAGTFDVARERTQRERQNGPGQAINEAFAAKDYATGMKLIDALVAKDPNAERMYGYNRLQALAHLEPATFKIQARKALAEADGNISVYQMLCSIPASDKELSPDVYRFGRTLVDEALQKKDREYLFQAMGAQIDSSLGDKAGAVRAQTAAVEAAATDSHCPPEFLQFLRNTLTKLKADAGK